MKAVFRTGGGRKAKEDTKENSAVKSLLLLPLLFVLAMVLCFLMEAFSRHAFSAAWDYAKNSPAVFLYNAYIVFMPFTILFLLKRRVFAGSMISLLWLFLGVCNGFLLSKRVTPFNAQDLKVIKDAASLVKKYVRGWEIASLAVGIAAAVALILLIWKKAPKADKRPRLLPGAILIAVTAAVFFLLTETALDHRIISNYFGNIAFAYEDYGLPYCFGCSVFCTGIDKPRGYGEEIMQQIRDDSKLDRTVADSVDKPNVIFVQLESFFDPKEVTSLKLSEDPIPTFRKLEKEYSSGYFQVPSVGAGTANTEFEVLTGMRMHFFGPGEYPYKTVLRKQTCESAATAFGNLGYATHAIHNNGGNFYSRALVFNNMGFDSYTSKEFMNITEMTETGWAKDHVLLEHVEDALDSSEGPDYIYCITVQGHGDYPKEPVLENPAISVSGTGDEGKDQAWEYFVNQTMEVDQFISDLISMIEERGEETVIVLYGDHLPTMGLEARDLKSGSLFYTEYVIWDNIGLKEKNKNLASFQITAEVMNRLGMHSGTIFNYHQKRRQTASYRGDLELLQYDILYGDQYVYGGNPPITEEETHMVMGLHDIHIDNIYRMFTGAYMITGDHFTEASRIFINGKQVKTYYLSDQRIMTDATDLELEDGDVFTVSQVGSGRKVFRSSQEYIYHEFQNSIEESEFSREND